MADSRRSAARRSRIRPPVGVVGPGLRNLGPRSTSWLRDIGITGRDDLVRMGVIEACRRMRLAGHPVSILAAYALEGALLDLPWNALPVEFKRQLVLDYRRMERATPRPPSR